MNSDASVLLLCFLKFAVAISHQYSLPQDVLSPLQAFAEEVGDLHAKVAVGGKNAFSLPNASDAYVQRIKAKLEAAAGKCTHDVQ